MPNEQPPARDGAPTFFELPLTATAYYISIFAKTDAEYTFQAFSDLHNYPRPGLQGRLTATQQTDTTVQLSWDVATGMSNGGEVKVSP